MDPYVAGGIAAAAALLAMGGTYLVVRRSGNTTADPLRFAEDQRLAETRGQELIEQSRREAEQILRDAELKARDDAFRRREELTRELDTARAEVREQERRAEKREDAAEQKQKDLARKEKHIENLKEKIADRRELLEKKAKHLDEIIEQETKQLHEITGLSREAAEKMLLDRLERELSERDRRRRSAGTKNRSSKHAEEKAREILATAIQRYAAEHTADTTVSTVDIPTDDMKGRIIGREGRNIRTFEKATGVDVIVDDTPGVVIVSGVRQRPPRDRPARADQADPGRPHPSDAASRRSSRRRRRRWRSTSLEVGKQAVLEANVGDAAREARPPPRPAQVPHQLQPERARSTARGRAPVRPDGRRARPERQLARRCGLLHDVGKAADHEMEGGHPKIGAELAKRYGETSKEVLHAIVGHHDDVTDRPHLHGAGRRRRRHQRQPARGAARDAGEVRQAAGGAGGGRVRLPGRRARLRDPGRPRGARHRQRRTDDATPTRSSVCRDIARAIEQQLDYPGEIKVTVVRETRSVETAK